MKIPSITPKNNTIIIELVILIAFLGGAYYLYTQFSSPSSVISQPDQGQYLLGAKSTLLYKAINQDKINFRDVSFLSGALVKELQDFSEVIPNTNSRGRVDPFIPYASSRPLR